MVAHYAEEHAELAGLKWDVLETVFEPERILPGGAGKLLALKKQTDGKTLVVVYREDAGDGFVITAFLTRREASARNRRKQLWRGKADINEFLKLMPAVRRSPHSYLWSSYDAEADVLYINFKKPSHATDSETNR